MDKFADRNGTDAAPFDGIICIGGEDWWYHNRGHFDFQIMRRIAREMPVLFVNSIGIRMPSPTRDSQFAKRIGRKLKSFARGLVEAEPGFWVFSPAMIPGRTGQTLTEWALAPQIRLAALRAGIRNPLLWIHCPPGASLLGQIPAECIVLQRTDRFEAFPDCDQAAVKAQVDTLKAAADLTIYCAEPLYDEERETVAAALLVTHGVELDRYRAAAATRRIPVDMAAIRGPRVGYVGSIDDHKFDVGLFLGVAAAMRDVSFVLVGGSSLGDDWCELPNVHQLGRVPYDQAARYMAAMDALILPANTNDWVAACNPIKLKEYLASGRPIVAADLPALDGWRDVVAVEKEVDGFAAALRRALTQPGHDLSDRLAPHTWDAKAALILAELKVVAAAKKKLNAARAKAA
ncbi:MAG: glycosyltransferase [Pseudomonadota bacterium]